MRSSGLQKGTSIGTFSKQAKAIVNCCGLGQSNPKPTRAGISPWHLWKQHRWEWQNSTGLDFTAVNSKQSMLQQKDRGTRRFTLMCIVDSCPLGVFRLKLLPRHLMQWGTFLNNYLLCKYVQLSLNYALPCPATEFPPSSNFKVICM